MVEILSDKIKKIESESDLDLLYYGDIVELKYRFRPLNKNKFSEVIGMYVSRPNEFYGLLKFVVPNFSEHFNSILMYKTKNHPFNLGVEEGKIALLEGRVRIEQYDLGSKEYNFYLSVMKRSGFVRD